MTKPDKGKERDGPRLLPPSGKKKMGSLRVGGQKGKKSAEPCGKEERKRRKSHTFYFRRQSERKRTLPLHDVKKKRKRKQSFREKPTAQRRTLEEKKEGTAKRKNNKASYQNLQNNQTKRWSGKYLLHGLGEKMENDTRASFATKREEKEKRMSSSCKN